MLQCKLGKWDVSETKCYIQYSFLLFIWVNHSFPSRSHHIELGKRQNKWLYSSYMYALKKVQFYIHFVDLHFGFWGKMFLLLAEHPKIVWFACNINWNQYVGWKRSILAIWQLVQHMSKIYKKFTHTSEKYIRVRCSSQEGWN